VSIIDELTAKTWMSQGAVFSPDEFRKAYYPKCGVTFEAREVLVTIDSRSVSRWYQTPQGWLKEGDIVIPARTQRTATFIVNEDAIADPDPATGKAPVRFDEEFLRKFMQTPFYEQGPDRLVSFPINDVKVKNNLLSVCFVIQMWDEDGKRRMLQRSFWSDGYEGTYCCS